MKFFFIISLFLPPCIAACKSSKKIQDCWVYNHELRLHELILSLRLYFSFHSPFFNIYFRVDKFLYTLGLRNFMVKRVMRAERHIRWNWERSSEQSDLVRYHFVVVDDKDREGTMNKLLSHLQYGGAIELIRVQMGRVKGGELWYLFQTYDSRMRPDMLDFSKIGKPVRKDPDLRERTRGSIENYVANLYSY